jgi:hypothetical protein
MKRGEYFCFVESGGDAERLGAKGLDIELTMNIGPENVGIYNLLRNCPFPLV